MSGIIGHGYGAGGGQLLLKGYGAGGPPVVQERGVVGLGDSLLGGVGIGASSATVGIGDSGQGALGIGTSQQEPT